MNIDRIDFISSYCDRWCERCAFTSRCSTYAIEVAIGMCDGDVSAAMELAIGVPPPMTEAEAARREAFLASLPDLEPTEEEVEECSREEAQRDERIDEMPITTSAEKVMLLATTWLDDHREDALATGDAALHEAVEIAGWDAFFIAAKLHRALHGRDEYLAGNPFDDDPVQNDWNGSAKVALISVRRSAHAWTTIAGVTGDTDASVISAELRQLRRQVERAFPDAWKFRRPGFDDGRAV